MAYGETKVYFDGSHYIAIPHTTRPSKKRYKPPEETVEVKDEKRMFALVRASFNQRRKTLVNGLSNAPELHLRKEQIMEALEKMNLPATVRGEALTLEQFAQLSNIL